MNEMYLENYYGSNNAAMLFLDAAGSCEISLTESTAQGMPKFRGKFQEANAVNKNKRMYPYDVLSSNLSRLMESVKGRGLLGELDHPSDSIIHFDKASHLITNLWFEGNVLMGEGEILPTPNGMVLKMLIDSGVRIGISSRGVGNGQVNNEGVLVIGESYKLITFDAVADPSTFAAYQKVVSGSKHENVMPRASNNSHVGNNSPVKNEGSSIHTLNTNALIAYTGQFIQKLTRDIKTERFH